MPPRAQRAAMAYAHATADATAIWRGSWTTRHWAEESVEFLTRTGPRPDAMRLTANMGPAMRPGIGRGIIDLEFRRPGGDWSPCTGCGGSGTHRVIISLRPDTDIAGFVFHVRKGLGIVDVQIRGRDGSLTPPAFEVNQGDPPTTHEAHIPHNEHFAGLRLRIEGPEETRRGRQDGPSQAECAAWPTQLGGRGVIDAAIMRTGWLTGNPAHAARLAARWPDGGIDAFLLREQISPSREGLVSRGIIDLCIVRPDGAIDCLTGNTAYTRERRIHIGRRTLCGIKVWETPNCGITDITFSFTDGSSSLRAFEDSDHGVADQARTWIGPTQAHAGAALGSHGWTPKIVGFDVREQRHYGIIDILPITTSPPSRSSPATLEARLGPPAESENWLMVSPASPRARSRSGGTTPPAHP